MKRSLSLDIPVVQFDDIESTYPKIPARFFKFSDARLIGIFGGFQLAVGPTMKSFYFRGADNGETKYVSSCGTFTITIEDT